MFGIRTKINQVFFLSLTKKGRVRFPQTGTPAWFIQLSLIRWKKLLGSTRMQWNLGWLMTQPSLLAIWTYRYFLDINPNHLGNWSIRRSDHWGTQKLEQETIRAMTDLYHADDKHIEGYVSSGGTEGNLYSLWVGRTSLQKFFTADAICLIRTSLSHYSITKAARIANVDEYVTPLSSNTWSMDPDALVHTLHRLSRDGYRGFLIPLTLGYTLTGTSDRVDKITQKIGMFMRIRPHAKCYIWMDAALNGLIAPFIDPHFSPFHSPLVQTVVVDFHKFGGVPYPAGIILYRKHLRRLIEQPISYLPDNDSTVLGSRSGAAAAAIWAVIKQMGNKGYRSIVKKQFEHKQYFLQNMRTIFPDAQIIHHPQSLSCGIVFPRSAQKIINQVSDKYGLYAKQTPIMFTNKTSRLRIYKFYFLPHTTHQMLYSFIRDLTR